MCWLWLSLVKHRWVLAHSLYHEESLNTKTMAWINTKIWEAARSLGQADGRGSSPAFTCTETNIKVKENEETGKYVPNKRTKITSPETSLSKTEISDSSHTVVYKHTHTHNEILFSHKKKKNSSCKNIKETAGHYAKCNKPEKDKYCLVSLLCGIQKKKKVKLKIRN